MSTAKKANRNHAIETYRFILSYLVVLTHVGMALIEPGTRWKAGLVETSMPLFFIISGYFLYSSDYERMAASLKKRIKKISLLTIQAVAGYYAMLFLFNWLQHDLGNYFHNYWAPKILIQMVVFNIPMICQPLWFLISMTYALILIYFAVRRNKLDLLCKLIPVSLGINLILSGEFNAVLPVQFDGFYARGFLVFALPFLLIGYLIHKNQESIIGLFSKGTIIISIIVFAILSMLEAEMVGPNAMMFSQIPVAFFLFLLALHYPEFGKDTIFERIGTRNSMHVYVMHRLLVLVYFRFREGIPAPAGVKTMVSSVIVFVCCICLSNCYLFVKERMSKAYAVKS